ncbi:MAG: uncharacterized protein QG600_324 [Patescibacteria group bacterium]|jgi:uncharacterized membrane protein (UPF0127 family)|nr:uncharacterized protein [Patescibacteria group bacterium]
MLFNRSKKTIISTDVRAAHSLFEKSKGLLFEKKPQTIIFKTRYGIHTFGMKFTIDVIILSKSMFVTQLKKSLKPNSVFFWNPLSPYVIELEEGTIEKLHIQIGDQLEVR